MITTSSDNCEGNYAICAEYEGNKQKYKNFWANNFCGPPLWLYVLKWYFLEQLQGLTDKLWFIWG